VRSVKSSGTQRAVAESGGFYAAVQLRAARSRRCRFPRRSDDGSDDRYVDRRRNDAGRPLRQRRRRSHTVSETRGARGGRRHVAAASRPTGQFQ